MVLQYVKCNPLHVLCSFNWFTAFFWEIVIFQIREKANLTGYFVQTKTIDPSLHVANTSDVLHNEEMIMIRMIDNSTVKINIYSKQVHTICTYFVSFVTKQVHDNIHDITVQNYPLAPRLTITGTL